MPLEITLASLGKLVVRPSIRLAVDAVKTAHARRREQVVEEQMMTMLSIIAVSDAEEAFAEAEAFLTKGDPAVDELLAEWQDAILDATLPSARIYLTLLFAAYLVHKEVADTFLRRAGKMLRDIDEYELQSLALLLSAISKASKGLPPRFASLAEGRTNIVAADGTTFEVQSLDGRPAGRVLASARLLTFERDSLQLDDDLAAKYLTKLCVIFARRLDEVTLVPTSRTGLHFDAKR